jgi:hypothetical protein
METGRKSPSFHAFNPILVKEFILGPAGCEKDFSLPNLFLFSYRQ